MLLVGVLLLIGAFGLFYWELNHPDPNTTPLQKLQKAQTVAVNVFVVVEAFYLLNCRSLRTSLWSIGLFSNPVVWIGIGGMAILQALFTYAPIMNRLFGSTPLHLNDWGLIFGFGFIAFCIVSFVKFLHIRFPRS
jgi:magnesium-transporting ATPase (P-type)